MRCFLNQKPAATAQEKVTPSCAKSWTKNFRIFTCAFCAFIFVVRRVQFRDRKSRNEPAFETRDLKESSPLVQFGELPEDAATQAKCTAQKEPELLDTNKIGTSRQGQSFRPIPFYASW